jgi:cytochrome c553
VATGGAASAAVALLLVAGGAALAETNPSVLAGSCANCHGPNGVSPGDIPSIAGAPYDVLKAQLEAFRAGEPADATIMPRLMRAYSDAEIDALARWFSEVSQ